MVFSICRFSNCNWFDNLNLFICMFRNVDLVQMFSNNQSFLFLTIGFNTVHSNSLGVRNYPQLLFWSRWAIAEFAYVVRVSLACSAFTCCGKEGTLHGSILICSHSLLWCRTTWKYTDTTMITCTTLCWNGSIFW